MYIENSKYDHGGNIYEELSGKELLDFSININPLGMGKAGEKRLKQLTAKELSVYPDYQYSRLAKSILQVHRIDSLSTDNIACSNGASQIIYSLFPALKWQKILAFAPTFSEYEKAASLYGCKVDKFYLKEEYGFSLETAIAELINEVKGPEYDALFLCNPNNPTGTVVDSERLFELIDWCEKNKIFLIIDHCFIEFTNIDEKKINEHALTSEWVLIIKATTKIFSMAGIRLGYCMSKNKALISSLKKYIPPWSVSTVAQLVGESVMSEYDEHVKKTQQNIAVEKAFLMEKLAEIEGIIPFEGSGNFILFKGPISLQEKLINEGILIRSCANFIGLSEDFYRTAVFNRNENKKLIEAIKACI